jgi:hypothetical protein
VRKRERTSGDSSAMTRVVEAERRFHDELAAARAEAAEIIAGAEAAVAAALEALERELPSLIAARRAELAAAAAVSVAAIEADGREHAARLDALAGDRLTDLAEDVLRQCPWSFSAANHAEHGQ